MFVLYFGCLSYIPAYVSSISDICIIYRIFVLYLMTSSHHWPTWMQRHWLTHRGLDATSESVQAVVCEGGGQPLVHGCSTAMCLMRLRRSGWNTIGLEWAPYCHQSSHLSLPKFWHWTLRVRLSTASSVNFIQHSRNLNRHPVGKSWWMTFVVDMPWHCVRNRNKCYMEWEAT